jgi:hypothetical protein
MLTKWISFDMAAQGCGWCDTEDEIQPLRPAEVDTSGQQ